MFRLIFGQQTILTIWYFVVQKTFFLKTLLQFSWWLLCPTFWQLLVQNTCKPKYVSLIPLMLHNKHVPNNIAVETIVLRIIQDKMLSMKAPSNLLMVQSVIGGVCPLLVFHGKPHPHFPYIPLILPCTNHHQHNRQFYLSYNPQKFTLLSVLFVPFPHFDKLTNFQNELTE
jgi:hypothetical protein